MMSFRSPTADCQPWYLLRGLGILSDKGFQQQESYTALNCELYQRLDLDLVAELAWRSVLRD